MNGRGGAAPAPEPRPRREGSLDAEARRRAEDLFEELLERSPSEREEVLARVAADDPGAAEAARALLAAHDREGGLLERSPLSPAGAASPTASGGEGEGALIGRYRILRVIGKGGMGNVYLAERADGQFRQRVALKIIPRVDPMLTARVVAERQILASLEHPNIARLLDGGVTADGRPYLVMEFVDGLPVDVYCDRMRLSVRERLRVFLTILHAVEHAHQNLVVHRDLKPSNVLVTPGGVVKLLDFGIAKLLNPTLASVEAPVTRTEHRVMTPEYASPEQLKGESITTTSDIYALGVLLYELLCGHRPYEVANLSLPQMLERICDKDPPPPSQRLAPRTREGGALGLGSSPTPEQVAEARHTTSFRLRRVLARDLDAVVMKALRKEPGRRYSSVELLAQDLRHFLEGLPVGAHRGNRWYRLQKTVQRHRGEALAAAIVLISLLAGTGVALWQAGVADRERDRAQEALRQSEEVTDFLLGLFQASDPAETPGDTVTVLDLLRRGSLQADLLVGEPQVQARMFQVMAQANRNLGRYGEASSLTLKAVALLEAELGPEHPTVADALVQAGIALRSGGLYDSARVVLTRAREIQEKALDPEAAEVATTLEHLAGVAVYLGDLTGAEEMARLALRIRERREGADDPAAITTLGTLASILRYEGRYREAEAAWREVIARRRRSPDPDPDLLSGDLLRLGDLLRDNLDGLDEAETLFTEALEIQEGETGAGRPNQVWALTSLAGLHEARGVVSGADALWKQAVEIRRRVYGDAHPLVSEILGAYSGFLVRAGRAREAEAIVRQALVIDHQVMDPRHSRHAGTLEGLAQALLAQGKLAEADSAARLALEIRTEAHGRRAPVRAFTLSVLARTRTASGDFPAAEEFVLEALEIVEGRPVDGSVRENVRGAAVDLYEAWGRPSEADRYRSPSR